MSDESPEDIDRALAAHLEYFADRTNLLFSYHFCIFEFREDDDFDGNVAENDRAWSLKTIRNACLHTSLIALRDLDDFFTPRTRNIKRDDLRASDFGCPRTLRFLTEDERKWINKLIAHTTQHGALKRGYGWDILELISKAIAQTDAFLEWMKSAYIDSHLDTWLAALGTQARTKSILKAIQTEATLEKSEAEAAAGQPATRPKSR